MNHLSSLKVLLTILVMTVLGAGTTAYYTLQRSGLALVAAAPDTIIPTNADLVADVNHTSAMQSTLLHLWSAYQSHPATTSAWNKLTATLKSGPTQASSTCLTAQQQSNGLLSALGDHVALATWLPAAHASASAVPEVALVAQVNVGDLLQNGGAPQLRDLGTTAVSETYRDTAIYTVTPNAACRQGLAGPVYASLISGDVVAAPSTTTLKRVIDTVKDGKPTLASNADYAATLATLPTERLFTVYVARSAARRLSHLVQQQDPGALAPLAQGGVKEALTRLQRPYALGVVATNNGIGIDTSLLPSLATQGPTTANNGVTLVPASTIVYASLGSLVTTVRPLLHLVPATDRRAMEAQLGISIERDLLPLIANETVIDLNLGTSPALATYNSSLAQAIAGTSTGYALPSSVPPGMLTLLLHVSNPSATTRALGHLTAAIDRALRSGSTSQKASASLFVSHTQADGIVLHTLNVPQMALPGIGYALHNDWLTLSTNIATAVGTPDTALATDTDYRAATADMANGAAPHSLEYVSLTHLLTAVDGWVAYIKAVNPAVVAQATDATGFTWPQAEALVQPLHSLIAYDDQRGRGQSWHAFLTVK